MFRADIDWNRHTARGIKQASLCIFILIAAVSEHITVNEEEPDSLGMMFSAKRITAMNNNPFLDDYKT